VDQYTTTTFREFRRKEICQVARFADEQVSKALAAFRGWADVYWITREAEL